MLAVDCQKSCPRGKGTLAVLQRLFAKVLTTAGDATMTGIKTGKTSGLRYQVAIESDREFSDRMPNSVAQLEDANLAQAANVLNAREELGLPGKLNRGLRTLEFCYRPVKPKAAQ